MRGKPTQSTICTSNELPRHRLAIPCQIATPSPRAVPIRVGHACLGIRHCGNQALHFMVDLRMFCYAHIRRCGYSRLMSTFRIREAASSWASATTRFAAGSRPGGCRHRLTLRRRRTIDGAALAPFAEELACIWSNVPGRPRS